MGKGTVNLGLGLQDVLKNGQTFRPVEISGLTGNDLNTRAFLAHVIIESQAAITGSRSTGDALKLYDFTLTTQ